MKRLFIFVLCVSAFVLMPGCEQEIDLSMLLASGSDIAPVMGTLSEQDAAEYLLITDEASENFGLLSPYIGKYTAQGSVSYACYDGYISPDDALRVNRSLSDSDLVPAEELYLRAADSPKLRVSPAADSETAALVSGDEIYPVLSVSFTDALYYSVSTESGRGYIRSDAVRVSSELAELEFCRLMEKYKPVGAQMTIIDNGQIRTSCAWGLADTENNREMTVDTTIRAASLSKLLFGMEALKLREEGVIDLDAGIGTYWGVEGLSENVTLRSVMNHTSSIKSLSEYPDAEELRELMQRKKFLVSSEKTGTEKAWRYNNFAVGVGGATLEVAAGCTMQTYASEKFFAPMGIDAAYGAAALPEGVSDAVLYSSKGGLSEDYLKSLEYSLSDTPGDNSRFFCGGLHISSEDYAKLLVMLINDGEYEGERILSADSVAEMETPCFEVSDPSGSFSQCLVLRKDEIYGRNLYYHSGNAYGTVALASYDPESGDGVVIIATGMSTATDDNGIYRICNGVSGTMYEEIL